MSGEPYARPEVIRRFADEAVVRVDRELLRFDEIWVAR